MKQVISRLCMGVLVAAVAWLFSPSSWAQTNGIGWMHHHYNADDYNPSNCNGRVLLKYGTNLFDSSVSPGDYCGLSSLTINSDAPRGLSIYLSNMNGSSNVYWGTTDASGVHNLNRFNDDYTYVIVVSNTCETCCGELGAETMKLGSVAFSVSLGKDQNGKGKGNLVIVRDVPTADMARPSGLRYETTPSMKVVLSSNVLRQVLAPQGLADVVGTNEYSYTINFYYRSQVGATNSAGIYQVSGSPFTSFLIENPNQVFNRLRITKSREGYSTVSEYEYTDTPHEWLLTTGNGLRMESLRSEWDTGIRVDTRTISNATNLVFKEENWFQVFPWGATNQIARKVGTTDPLVTTYEYYTNGVNVGRLKQTVEPYGYWERYEYDSAGRQSKVVSPYKDAAVGAAESLCRVVTTTYSTNAPHITVVEKVMGYEIARSYEVRNSFTNIEIRCQTPGASWTASDNLVTTNIYYGNSPSNFVGEIQSTLKPDGTASLYLYSANSSSATCRTNTVLTGAYQNGTVVDGTRNVTVIASDGAVLRSESYDIASGLLLSRAINQTNALGQITRTDYLDGTYETKTYNCCGLASQTDREGITTSYIYDGLRRVISTTRAGVTTSNAYDAADRVVATYRNGVRINASTYDTLGRQLSSVDALTNLTSYSETTNATVARVLTTTRPDGTTVVENYHVDRQLRSTVGTGVHLTRIGYLVEQDEGSWRLFTKPINRLADGTDTTEWTKTYVDMLGRPYKTVRSDGVVLQRSYYNNAGQLVKQVDADGVTTLFAYNAKGEQTVTAIDVDRNGNIDFGGTDRITSNAVTIVSTDLGTTRRSTTWVYSETGPVTVSVNEASIDGLRSRTMSYGLTSSAATVYDRANARRTITSTAPDGSYNVDVYDQGRLSSSSSYDALGVQLGGVTNQYEAAGLLRWAKRVQPSGVVSSAYYYDPLDRVVTVTNAYGKAEQQVTRTQYDLMGRRAVTILPDGASVTNEYFSTGEPKKTYGARTYPVEFTYDYAGRMATMKTWKSFASGTGAATTAWSYDPVSGQLVGKTYADNSSVDYSNSPAGRLESRAWARGITTSYGYNNAGDLASVTYSDGTTPNVSFTYDRRGRRTSVTDGAGEHTLTYNDAGQLLTESFPNSAVTVTSGYDALLRRSSLNSGTGVSPVSFTYDDASRLSSVGQGSQLVQYAYLRNSSLVSNITFKTGGVTKMSTTKSYDNLFRMTSIRTQDSGFTTRDSHSYVYNKADQRTKRTDADNSYWDYGYDSLGQVTNAVRRWSDGSLVTGQQYGFGFDDIGNRNTKTANGRTEYYQANSLNQYTQRTVPSYILETGSAASNATVTLNLQPVNRKGEYFSQELYVNNLNNAVYTQLTTVAVLKNAGSNQADIVSSASGKVFLAQTPEQFTHDADGNLISDGRWQYTWDAENRLIAMESSISVTSAPSVVRTKLEFAYDAQWRRISKKVYSWNSDSWLLTSDLRFVYDGWNLLAEIGPTGSVVRSYVWGLDLSGSEQGAGGIGGLLWAALGTNMHFYAHDGNGNVTALLNADTGTLSAQYEYGPFGETIRATGAAAAQNIFRFSAKYTDSETGLVYYGYRYYQPSVGRWLSRDPVEEQGGLNVFAFYGDDLINECDSLGDGPLSLLRNRVKKYMAQKGVRGVLTHVHHIILKDLWADPVLGKWLVEIGIERDALRNLILLPTREGKTVLTGKAAKRAGHFGGHLKEYAASIRDRIEFIKREVEAGQMTVCEAREEIFGMQRQLRLDLRNGNIALHADERAALARGETLSVLGGFALIEPVSTLSSFINSQFREANADFDRFWGKLTLVEYAPGDLKAEVLDAFNPAADMRVLTLLTEALLRPSSSRPEPPPLPRPRDLSNVNYNAWVGASSP